jgi:integrase/recombinase XerD
MPTGFRQAAEQVLRSGNIMETRQLPLFDWLDGREHRLTSRSTLAEAIPSFQAYLRGEGKTQNTIISFASDMRVLCEFIGDDFPLGRITTARLNEYLHWLEHGRGISCSRKSYARRVTTLKVFFKWLKEDRVRRDDPAQALLQRSGPAPLQTILSEAEIGRLLAYTAGLRVAEKPDPRPDVLLRLLLDTGIKKSETVQLRVEDVERRNEHTPMLNIRHKTRQNIFQERRIPLDPAWPEALDEYLAQYQPAEGRVFDCTARNLEYVLSDTAKAAGVESRVSFDALRWTCAVRDYRRGMNMETLREKMGLSRISWRETGQKIARLAAGELAEAEPDD